MTFFKSISFPWACLVMSIGFGCATGTSHRLGRSPAELPIPESKTPVSFVCPRLNGPEERRACALVERDAIETLGLMVDFRMLGIKWEAMPTHSEAARRGVALSGVIGLRGGWGSESASNSALSSALHAALGTVFLGGAALSTRATGGKLQSILGSVKLTEETSWLFGPNVMSITLPSVLLIDAIAGSAGADEFQASTGKSLSNTFFTRAEIAGEAGDPSKAASANQRAAKLRRNIRKISEEIAARTVGILRLRLSDRLVLTTEIEDELIRQIPLENDPEGDGTPSAVKLDLFSLLRKSGVEFQPQLDALNAILAEVKVAGEKESLPAGGPEVTKVLAELDRELEAMLASSDALFKVLVNDGSDEVKPIKAEILGFTDRCETLQRKIRAHQAGVSKP